jgi:biopolymer transport protein ExbD
MAIQLEAGKGGRRVRPTMNVTPLVDVVLVLLIIFMVMTPLMTRVMSLHVPSEAAVGSEEPAGDDGQVVLTVQADGSIRLNQDIVEDRDLPGKLRRVFAARADQTLFFDAAGNVPFARAVEVLDLARGTGLETIAVLTEAVVAAAD